jgi:hypothetical protein
MILEVNYGLSGKTLEIELDNKKCADNLTFPPKKHDL